MTAKYEIRTVKVAVLPKGDNLFSERATYIEIVDESAGEFLEIFQETGSQHAKLRIDDDEWPIIRDAIDNMAASIKKTDSEHA